VQTELIAFITPRVVDTPVENYENFNVGERERLREMSRPMKELERDADQIRRRILDPTEIDPHAVPPQPRRDDGVFDPIQRDP
jgi:uncharacterized protein Yka (UPF0111/DUF47 family)